MTRDVNWVERFGSQFGREIRKKEGGTTSIGDGIWTDKTIVLAEWFNFCAADVEVGVPFPRAQIVQRFGEPSLSPEVQPKPSPRDQHLTR